MKEIGGYIELDTYSGLMLHNDGIKLNCGRTALEYLIKSKGIKTLWYPKFMCDSCDKILNDYNINVKCYSIGLDFKPVDFQRTDDEYLYIVNNYGQLSNEYILSLGKNTIVDNAQAYFYEPLDGTDTIYTCRKFFGVADGGILYTDKFLEVSLPQDESFERMKFLLGRYERSAGEFYSEYVANNDLFNNEPLKRMSKLTENLLHGIDYKRVKQTRTENFTIIHNEFKNINKLKLTIPIGAFMYPLYIENGYVIRKALQKQKIFIPTLWPSVYDICNKTDLEYDMAKNILPLPCDQRYSADDMCYMINTIKEYISKDGFICE